jgi:hypothetical protein
MLKPPEHFRFDRLVAVPTTEQDYGGVDGGMPGKICARINPSVRSRVALARTYAAVGLRRNADLATLPSLRVGLKNRVGG